MKTKRIELIKKPKFINHPKAEKLFKKLDSIKNSKDVFLLVGNANNGKSTMLKKYYEMNVYKDDEKMLFFEHAMLIQAPYRASLHELYDNIFQFFVMSYYKENTLNEREKKIRHYCEVNEVKIIIIDEIQEMLVGNITKQLEVMQGIKRLSKILEIPIVLVGNLKSLDILKLENSFIPIKIKRWSYDEDYLLLLKEIENTLPLKKVSNIYKNEKLAREILELSDGLIGDIVTICELLAIRAIKSKKEKIEYSMINEIDYIPSDGVVYDDRI